MARTKRQKKLSALRQAAKQPTVNKACPTPLKPRYTHEQAIHMALSRSRYAAKVFSIYPCKCGYWHLTTKRKKA